MSRNVALKGTRLERSRVWQLMLHTHPELLDDLLARAAGVAGAREERRLGALTPAMRVLTVAERRRLLGALRSRLAGASGGMVAQLKVLTVPKPAPVRPDLALGFGPDAALTVLATIDGKARTLGAVNAPTAQLAFGVDDPAGLPAAVRANGLWYVDARGSLVVNQTEAYRHPPVGAFRHRWLPPNWTLTPSAEWLWLTPAPASYAPYAPG